jgi:transposase
LVEVSHLLETRQLSPVELARLMLDRLTTVDTRLHSSQEALALVDAIPPLHGERGRPRQRPDCVLGDRGYDAAALRRGLRTRHIVPLMAVRRTEHGSGLGPWRWVVERTFSWLNQFRRLRVRYDKRADIHEAFLSLGCALICRPSLRKTWRTA